MRRLILLASLVAAVLAAPALPSTGTAWAQVMHNCDFCHNLHGGSFNQLQDFEIVEDLCLSCHGPGGPPTWNRDGVDVPIPKNVEIHNGAKHTEPTSCWDCHDHEGEAGANLKMIPLSRSTPNTGVKTVNFTAVTGPNSFADGDANFDGICEVCHTITNEHRHDGSAGQHNAAVYCTACHPHANGFAGMGTCNSCHSVAQGSRRPIVGEFSRSSHHVQTPDTVKIADCLRCHEMSQHRKGNVRLSNVDDGSVIVLNGDPASSSTEAAKLTTFCLACHDADGAGGSAPFSDGLMPPVVDATAWTASSHNASAAIGGCYGDGNFGCHASGHGSDKIKLLAPAGVAPTPPANAEEEEGFCFNCHDANGPAATDMQAEFNRATRHNVSANDPAGEFVECTNCHNPHIATSANKLANPDDQARTAWTGTFEAFCLTCHDGGPPSGISFPGPSGSGFDKSKFVSSTHDTQIGGTDSCRSCHEQHGSANLALLKARYVTADFNQWDEGDGDYQICWTCHDENFIVRQDNRFENLHDRHVRGEDAPCIMCHDAHGPFDAGEPGLNSFNVPISMGHDISFIDGRNASTAFSISGNQGSCYILCHGMDHTPETYVRQ